MLVNKKRDLENVPQLQNHLTGESSMTAQRYKNKSFVNQRKRVFAYYQKGMFTMKMVSVATGIDRANICRIVSELKMSDSIFLVRKGYCQITKYKAGYYSTNPIYRPITPQLKMTF
jgi:predicted molibdopterin-dependent oxidoreductase YjgC